MDDATTKSTRGPRSPGYPAITLEEGLKRAKTLYDYSPGRKPIPVDTALTQWKYKAKSGAGLQLLASLKKFGLLEDKGSKDQRTVVVTERAFRILTDDRPNSEGRQAALREAALAPKIHADIHDRWPHGLPDDSQVRVWLIQEKKFNPKAVSSFLNDVKATFQYAKLDSTPETGEDDDSNGGHGEPATIAEGRHVQWTSQGVARFEKPRKVLGLSEDQQFAYVEGSKTGIPVNELTIEDPPAADRTPPPNPFAGDRIREERAAAGTKQDVFALDSGKVVVSWPDSLTQSDYDDIKDWLQILERKIGRSIKRPDPDTAE